MLTDTTSVHDRNMRWVYIHTAHQSWSLRRPADEDDQAFGGWLLTMVSSGFTALVRPCGTVTLTARERQ